VGVLTVLALQYPLVAAGLALIVLIVMALVVPRLVGGVWFIGGALAASLRALVSGSGSESAAGDVLPAAHQALIGAPPPALAGQCRAQRLPGANGRLGYLSLLGDRVCFTYDARQGPRLWQIGTYRLSGVAHRRRTLIDTLAISYADERARERRVHFVFLKDRAALAEQMADDLACRHALTTGPARQMATGE
jgi:hypothetical protein